MDTIPEKFITPGYRDWFYAVANHLEAEHGEPVIWNDHGATLGGVDISFAFMYPPDMNTQQCIQTLIEETNRLKAIRGMSRRSQIRNVYARVSDCLYSDESVRTETLDDIFKDLTEHGTFAELCAALVLTKNYEGMSRILARRRAEELGELEYPDTWDFTLSLVI